MEISLCAGQTGEAQGMKKSHESGVATHIDPESCGAARQGGVDALTRKRAGRGFSRVGLSAPDADAASRSGRTHPMHRYREAILRSPGRSQTPGTYGGTSLGNREISSSPRVAVALGRIGK